MSQHALKCSLGVFGAASNILQRSIVSKNFLICGACHRGLSRSAPTNSDVDPSSRKFESNSPYKGVGRQLRERYVKKRYDGGILPRPEEMKDVPLNKLPEYNPKDKDQWSKEKALFGQNDYIDILGDGTVHPADTIEGPTWLRRSKGNEFRRILRQFAFEDEYLREMEPAKYHMMEKNARYLHKDGSRRIAHRGHTHNPKRKARTDRFNTSKNFTF